MAGLAPGAAAMRRGDHPVRLGRLEWVLQWLIVATLVTLAVETLPSLTPGQRQALQVFEMVAMTVSRSSTSRALR